MIYHNNWADFLSRLCIKGQYPRHVRLRAALPSILLISFHLINAFKTIRNGLNGDPATGMMHNEAARVVERVKYY